MSLIPIITKARWIYIRAMHKPPRYIIVRKTLVCRKPRLSTTQLRIVIECSLSARSRKRLKMMEAASLNLVKARSSSSSRPCPTILSLGTIHSCVMQLSTNLTASNQKTTRQCLKILEHKIRWIMPHGCQKESPVNPRRNFVKSNHNVSSTGSSRRKSNSCSFGK